jgi:hypothetical protein
MAYATGSVVVGSNPDIDSKTIVIDDGQGTIHSAITFVTENTTSNATVFATANQAALWTRGSTSSSYNRPDFYFTIGNTASSFSASDWATSWAMDSSLYPAKFVITDSTGDVQVNIRFKGSSGSAAGSTVSGGYNSRLRKVTTSPLLYEIDADASGMYSSSHRGELMYNISKAIQDAIDNHSFSGGVAFVDSSGSTTGSLNSGYGIRLFSPSSSDKGPDHAGLSFGLDRNSGSWTSTGSLTESFGRVRSAMASNYTHNNLTELDDWGDVGYTPKGARNEDNGSAHSTNTFADSIKKLINAMPIAVTATVSSGTVSITNDAHGTDGNQTITTNYTTSFTVSGMSGGASADSTPPTISSIALSSSDVQNSTLIAGDVVSATLTMDEATTVVGTPYITLTVGSNSRNASYASGTGTTSLVFSYTIVSGDADTDGISIGANAVALNGGTMRDAAANNATITHSAVSANSGLTVDNTAPTISSLSVASDNSTVTVTFAENVYASSGGTGGLAADDFVVTLANGNATGIALNATPSGIVNTSAAIHVLTLNGTLLAGATGDEALTVTPASSAIYDAGGNVATAAKTAKLNSAHNDGDLSFDQVRLSTSHFSVVAASGATELKDAGITFAKLATAGYTTNLSSSATSSQLARADAIKTYVDAQVTAQDLDFQGDAGGALSIDLDSETLDIAGGAGITTTGSGNEISVAVDAAQTGITSILNNSLKLGYGASDAHIDFSTDNKIMFDVDNAEVMNIQTGTVAITGALTLTTDLAVAQGGTGVSTLTDGGVLLGSGTSAVTAMAVLADGEMIVGDGSTDPVAESGATLRTSIGVGTGDSPQFTAVNVGAASDTTLARSSGGVLAVEGNVIYHATGTDIPVTDGGTGVSTLTDGGILLGSGTDAVTAMAVLADGEIVIGDGSTDPIAYAAFSASDGTLKVSHGGIGVGTLTDGGILLGSGTGAVTAMSVLSDGQMIVGDGTTDPVAESGDTLRISVGVGSTSTWQITGLEIGHASNTTLARPSAGDLSIEGNIIYRAGGTDVPVTDGGTGVGTFTDGGILLGSGTNAVTAMAVLADGAIVVGDGNGDPVALAAFSSSTGTLNVASGGIGVGTLTDGGILLGSGTSAVTAMAVLADSEMIVGDGSTDPVAESGATLRTSIGVGTGDSPQFTAVNVGAASDTTLARSSAGVLSVEGNVIYHASGTDVPVADGGTGASTLTDGGVLLGSGTGAITAMSVLSDGQMIVGDGTGDPVAESGSTLMTSIGVGTGDSPTFTGLTLSGNLIVQGTTTSLNTTQFTVEDKAVRFGIPSGMTAVGTATYQLSSNEVTVTSAGHGMSNSEYVLISDPAGSVTEGVYQITSVDDVNTFTFAFIGSNVGSDTAIQHSVANVTNDTADGSGIFASPASTTETSFKWDKTNGWSVKGADLDLAASTNLSFAGANILADSGGTMTLSNIDALDATTEATIESAIDTLGSLTSASALATVGTITSGTWQGTDVGVAYGGTGVSTLTDGGVLLGSGTSAVTAMAVLADGEMIVGDGSTDPVAESGATLRTSIGVGTGDSPQFTAVNVGAASDTTLARSSAGNLSVEGNLMYRAGGTDIPVADGGTGASSLTDGGILLGSGTSAVTAMAVLADGEIVIGDGSTDPIAYAAFSASDGTLKVSHGGIGVGTLTDGGILLGSGTGAVTAMSVLGDGEMIVGDGTTDPVAESGTTLRTSIGVGTGDSPQFTAVNVGAASDTTLARSSAGVLSVEGNVIYHASGTDVPVTDGGTGVSTHTAGAILLGAGSSAVTNTGVLADGVILIGDGTGAPTLLDVGSSSSITVLGTVATGVWQGTAIASGYIAANAVTGAKLSTSMVKSFHATGGVTTTLASAYSEVTYHSAGTYDTGAGDQTYGAGTYMITLPGSVLNDGKSLQVFINGVLAPQAVEGTVEANAAGRLRMGPESSTEGQELYGADMKKWFIDSSHKNKIILGADLINYASDRLDIWMVSQS